MQAYFELFTNMLLLHRAVLPCKVLMMNVSWCQWDLTNVSKFTLVASDMFPHHQLRVPVMPSLSVKLTLHMLYISG